MLYNLLVLVVKPLDPCKIRQKRFFSRGNITPFISKSFHIWNNFFPLLFPKDSESLKQLDVRLLEVRAKGGLNSTSKVKTRTDRQTDGHTDGHWPRGPILWKVKPFFGPINKLKIKKSAPLCYVQNHNYLYPLSCKIFFFAPPCIPPRPAGHGITCEQLHIVYFLSSFLVSLIFCSPIANVWRFHLCEVGQGGESLQ